MASGTFTIRCKTEKGPYTLDNLKSDSTIEDLKQSLQKLTKMKPERMKFLGGYPPKPLVIKNDCLKLHEVSIHSGDTLIVETRKDLGDSFQNLPAAIQSPPSGFQGPVADFQGPGADFQAPAADFPNVTSKFQSPAANLQSTAASLQSTAASLQGTAVDTEKGIVDELMFHQSGIMMRHEVPSNNSCLFTSVYFILSNGEMNLEKSNDLRKIIANAVLSNPSKYNAAVLGKPNHEYCSWIQDTTHWGGAIELAILSEHFKLEIVAIDTMSLIPHRFGENNDYQNRIFLIYDGIHYDPLVLELEGDKQTIFPGSDPRPMQMALEIANEAKSSRQFTDIAHFTISCKICHCKLHGEKEAREHASATGHCEFGEL